MEKFIYVFSEELRDKLISSGYILLGENKTGNGMVYIFENSMPLNMCFSYEEVGGSYAYSDTLFF